MTAFPETGVPQQIFQIPAPANKNIISVDEEQTDDASSNINNANNVISTEE